MSRYGDWFVKIVESYNDYLSKEVIEGITEAWIMGEDEIAYDSFIGSLEWQDVSFSSEIQRQLLDYGAKLDKFNEEKWEEYQKEFTPEQIKKFELKKRPTDYVELLQKMFNKPHTAS